MLSVCVWGGCLMWRQGCGVQVVRSVVLACEWVTCGTHEWGAGVQCAVNVVALLSSVVLACTCRCHTLLMANPLLQPSPVGPLVQQQGFLVGSQHHPLCTACRRLLQTAAAAVVACGTAAAAAVGAGAPPLQLAWVREGATAVLGLQRPAAVMVAAAVLLLSMGARGCGRGWLACWHRKAAAQQQQRRRCCSAGRVQLLLQQRAAASGSSSSGSSKLTGSCCSRHSSCHQSSSR
jgi:hypothetical protein